MSNESKRPEEQKNEAPDLGYIPASPVKRTMAWIGLAYALIFLGLTPYYFFTGTMLGNLPPLLTIPGLIGLGALALVSHKSTGSPGKAAAIIIAVVCWVLALVTLPIGIAGLLSNFGG